MTRTLFILCTLAAIVAAVGLMRAVKAADRARLTGQELVQCRDFLADSARVAAAGELGIFELTPAVANGSPLTGLAQEAGGDLTSRIRQAGRAAGVSELLSQIETGEPVVDAGSGQREAVLFLHFNAMTLEELTRFLHHLATSDSTSRTTMIELTPPDGSAAGTVPSADAERWSTDVTLAYRLKPATAGTAKH